ncbi:putative hydantoin racemase [Teratosphaeria destructans]|uniref:Hydantoin racemase n=1 Tax=Teratosphaeria destructans TaxID=418781 RepID=A0A9W7SQQ0_9PEZI|nr:putative hydantoin racemase [Teratosphaeria destructans]
MPGRTRSIRVLLVNPNATPSMTENCVSMVLPTLPADVQLVPFTAPEPAPTAIEGAVDNILSSAASFRAILTLQQAENYDAILVACYSDHGLIKMLREEFDVPVIGIMEASLFAARTLGARFGIIATGPRSKVRLADEMRTYGMEKWCAGIESCDLGVLGLHSNSEDLVHAKLQNAARSLVVKGAEVITLGCAGMADMKAAVENAVREDGVQVVDGVLAGVHHLVGMVRMSCRTATRGLYAASSEGRKNRQQEYI